MQVGWKMECSVPLGRAVVTTAQQSLRARPLRSSFYLSGGLLGPCWCCGLHPSQRQSMRMHGEAEAVMAGGWAANGG